MNPPLLVWTHEENQLKGQLRGMPGTTLAIIEPANPQGDVFLMSAVSPDAEEQERRVLTVEAAKALAEEQLLTWFRQTQPILGASLLTAANTDAARELLRTEAALMGVPLAPDQLERADLGRVLDAAHETIHELTTSSEDRHTIGLAKALAGVTDRRPRLVHSGGPL